MYTNITIIVFRVRAVLSVYTCTGLDVDISVLFKEPSSGKVTFWLEILLKTEAGHKGSGCTGRGVGGFCSFWNPRGVVE